MTVSKPPLPLLLVVSLISASLAAACWPARGTAAYMSPEHARASAMLLAIAAVAQDLRDVSVAPSSSAAAEGDPSRPNADLIPVLAPTPPGTWARYEDCFAAGGSIAKFTHDPVRGWSSLECFRVREEGRSSLHPIPLDGEL